MSKKQRICTRLHAMFKERAVWDMVSIDAHIADMSDKEQLSLKEKLVVSADGKNCTLSAILEQEKLIEACAGILVRNETVKVQMPVAVDEDIIETVCLDFIARARKWDDAPRRAHVHAQLMRSQSRLVILGGAPGTAKSTTALELMKAYKLHRARHLGTHVCDYNGLWVLAINPFAMEKWRGRAGVQGTTIDQVITTQEMGVKTIPDGAFVVVDEAGLIGTEKMSILLQKAVEGQWQKLVLMGDIKQDLPREYGQPLSYMIDYYPDISFELKTPFRQKNRHEREFVQSLYDGNAQQALVLLNKKNRLWFAKQDAIIRKLVESIGNWRVKGNNLHKQCLVLVQDSRTALAVNEAIIDYQIKHNIVKDSWDYQGPIQSWRLGEGDRVMLQQPIVIEEDGKSITFGQGTMATIIKADADTMTLSIDRKGNQEVTVIINRHKPHQVSPAYALTFGQAQGIAADFTAILITQPINGPAMISAGSRHRYDCAVFVDSALYKKPEDFADAIKHFPVKEMPYLDKLVYSRDRKPETVDVPEP